MEALKLKTLDDLLASPDERVELIDGEIVRRPMARAEHGFAQGNTVAELDSFRRTAGPGGWWIASEISVHYEAHQCPSHDLAGWRKERLPERPSGVIEVIPDWVCEIVSPGHERKDTLTLLLLLQRHGVPLLLADLARGPGAGSLCPGWCRLSHRRQAHAVRGHPGARRGAAVRGGAD